MYPCCWANGAGRVHGISRQPIPRGYATYDSGGGGLQSGTVSPDLAIANAVHNNVTVLLGDGMGAFSAAPGSPFPAGSQPSSVATGDFNGDGKPDLAISNYLGFSITVLLGDGMGAFTGAPGSPIPVGEFPYSVSVADFNRDGKPDLTIPNSLSKSLTILMGDGTGGFTPAPGSPFPFPGGIAVGDFNGDSKPDLAVAVNGAITILQNTAGYVYVMWEEPVIGWAQIWYLGGPQGVSVTGAANLTQANPWHIVAVADFDGNAHSGCGSLGGRIR